MARLAGFFGALVLAAAVAGVSAERVAAQTGPFSLRSDQTSDLPSRASPVLQQSEAAAAAAPLSPANPQTQRNLPATVRQGTREVGPAPFDVNNDGIARPYQLPVDQQTYSSQSTTTSPLTEGGGLAPVVPFDAINAEQIRNLNTLLKQSDDQVRELRVNVEDSQEFVDSIVDRPIVPYRTLRLDGEISEASFTVYLTAAEAARGGTLSVAFTNSVLVLPEASRLRIFLNGRQIAQTSIDSPDRTKVVALPIDSSLMRPGANAVRLMADMRHRIDCSLDATYELWARVDTRLTGFSFGGGRIPLAGLNDLPAVGVATNGATRIRVIQRRSAAASNVDRMLRAVQAAALRGQFVQPLVEIVREGGLPVAGPGVLNIIIGTYDDVRRISPIVPSEGAIGPVTTLIDTEELGATVVITGPNERAVDAALSRFDAPPQVSGAETAITAIPPWLVPDAVRVGGARSVTLREAGVETINFSGRRFSADFQVLLPPDFFAAAYGEATMFLDAAYSRDVEPGSRFTVFVNGLLSTAISFTSTTGEVLEDFPIVLLMENFRPGINNIEIIVDLETAQDRECLPGGTVPARDRFALFSSTRIVFPSFARIGQLPNLASFATNGFPYQLSSDPVRVRVGGNALDTIGAAGTMMARIAVSRGMPLATNVVEDASSFADQGLIVVGPLDEVANVTLETTGAAGVVPSTWLTPGALDSGAPDADGLERYDDVLRRLRQQLRQEEIQLDRTAAAESAAERDLSFPVDQRSETQRTRLRWSEELSGGEGVGTFIGNALTSIRNAINLNFDVDFAGRRSGDAVLDVDPVSEAATVLLAQAEAPTNSSTAWTLITAPTPGLLSASVASLTAPEVWTRIGGRITAYSIETNEIDVVPARRVSYLATLPLSFGNLRLIAANWFSINNGIYALGLIAAALILGIVTYFVMIPLGRQNEKDES